MREYNGARPPGEDALAAPLLGDGTSALWLQRVFANANATLLPPPTPRTHPRQPTSPTSPTKRYYIVGFRRVC